MQHCILSAGLRGIGLGFAGVATLLLFGGISHILKESQPTKSAFEVLPVGFLRGSYTSARALRVVQPIEYAGARWCGASHVHKAHIER
jgi:hypothetical protein